MGDASRHPQEHELIDGLLRATLEIQRKLATIAARHDLTAQQAMLLRSLEQPTAMSTLAEAKGCDPSNVTGLVDRIARLGLIDRQADPDDRRVKLLALTPEGRRIRDSINQDLAREISHSFDGSISEQAELNRLLRLM